MIIMKNQIKALIITMTLVISACGSQDMTYLPNSAVGNFLIINPTPNPIPIIVEPNPTAKSAKTVNMATGEQFSEDILNPGVSATVAGCIDARKTGGSRICYEDDPSAITTAITFANSTIQAKIEEWAGSTGNPDIVIIKNPGNFFAGFYSSPDNRIVIATQNGQINNLSIFAHELTHAAYHTARHTDEPRWINETLAVWSETQVADGYTRAGSMSNDVTSWSNLTEDYTKASYLARYIQLIQQQPLNIALTSPDIIQSLTGLDLSTFSKQFWSLNWLYFWDGDRPDWIYTKNMMPPVNLTTASTTEIPPFGAVSISGRASWGEGGILRQ